MSNVADEGRLDYSKFDNIDSDILEAYLQADFNAPEAEQMDPDAIFYILNLLEVRQKNDQTELSDDTSAALERFYSDYYPTLEDEQRFFEFYNEFGENTSKTATNNTKRQPKKRISRLASIAVAVVFCFCIGSVVCYAGGFNPLKIIGIWNDDQCWFESNSVTKELAELVADYAGDIQLVPEWLPDGYVFDNVTVSGNENDMFEKICAEFYRESNDDIDELYIDYIFLHNENEKFHYEKDSANVEIYTKYGIEYHIIEDLGVRLIIWRNGIYECFITGNFSIAEAKKIVNSIYGE